MGARLELAGAPWSVRVGVPGWAGPLALWGWVTPFEPGAAPAGTPPAARAAAWTRLASRTPKARHDGSGTRALEQGLQAGWLATWLAGILCVCVNFLAEHFAGQRGGWREFCQNFLAVRFGPFF